MRTVAQVFRDVIAAGLHSPGSFMCSSLDVALEHGFITGAEFAAAKDEITSLMKSLIAYTDPADCLHARSIRDMSLAYINAHSSAHICWTDWNRFKMYQNWENRWALYTNPPGPSPREFVTIVRELDSGYGRLPWQGRVDLIEANRDSLNEIEYEYTRGVLARALTRPIISVIAMAETVLSHDPSNVHAREVRAKAKAMRCNIFNVTLSDLVSLSFKGKHGIMDEEEMSICLTQVWHIFEPMM